MSELGPWWRAEIDAPGGEPLGTVTVGAVGGSELVAVDIVARLVLDAERSGMVFRVTGTSERMAEVLRLAALERLVVPDAGTCGAGAPESGVEVERQPERGEEALGGEEGQEEVHPGDPAALDLEHL